MSRIRTPIILHYTGYVWDGGGIHAVIRTLFATGRFRMIQGVSPQFVRQRQPAPKLWRGPAVQGEEIGLGNLVRTFLVAWRVSRWLSGGEHRIFHGHSRAGVLVAMWLRTMGAHRVVVTVHVLGRRTWFYRAAKKILGERLRWLSPAMGAHYGEESVAWSECLPDCFLPQPVVTRSRKYGATRVFGCAGTVVEVKNWELILQALALIPREVAMRVVHVGGEGGERGAAEYAEKLRALSRQLGVADRFEWRGECSDMPAFFSEIDCLIVASRWEASSVAALEALAADVPVLAPDDGGTRALVEVCDGGWLFTADDPPSLATQMEQLARDARLAAWRVDAWALARFTHVAVAEAHAAIYASLTHNHGRRE